MKSITLFLAVFVMILTGISCKKDSSGADNTLSGLVVSGTWSVHLYTDNGADFTNNYSGYSFQFKSGGAMSATKAPTTTSGIWAEVEDSGKTKFILSWVGGAIPVALLEIEEDWVLTSKSSTMIELSNTNGSGVTRVLHFQKN